MLSAPSQPLPCQEIWSRLEFHFLVRFHPATDSGLTRSKIVTNVTNDSRDKVISPIFPLPAVFQVVMSIDQVVQAMPIKRNPGIKVGDYDSLLPHCLSHGVPFAILHLLGQCINMNVQDGRSEKLTPAGQGAGWMQVIISTYSSERWKRIGGEGSQMALPDITLRQQGSSLERSQTYIAIAPFEERLSIPPYM
jgi:hypothetical protein